MTAVLYTAVAAATLVLLFYVLPGIAVTWLLCRHRSPGDLDIAPRKTDPAYEPFREAFLEDIAWMRGQEHTEAAIRAADGTALYADWYARGPRAVLCAHGFRGTPLNNFSGIGRMVLENGWSLLAIEQRGHLRSGGRCSFGIRESEDLKAWVTWLAEEAGCTEIVLYGISMGAAAVNRASSGPWPDAVSALISDCGYTSIPAQAESLMGGMAFHRRLIAPMILLCLRLLYGKETWSDARENLKRARRPMLFLGGTADTVVTADTVRRAAEACGTEKKLLVVDKAPHTMAIYAGGQNVRTAVLDFMTRS